MNLDINETLTFTVDELIRHLVILKRRGVLTGKEEVVDTAFFGISHVGVDQEHKFIIFYSNEAEDAMRHGLNTEV